MADALGDPLDVFLIRTLGLQRQEELAIGAIAAEQTCDEFRDYVDEVVCAFKPEPFVAVGIWYEDLSQTTDQEMQILLKQAQS